MRVELHLEDGSQMRVELHERWRGWQPDESGEDGSQMRVELQPDESGAAAR
jgi:hypothetical protein